jgi:hypothetical protein
MYSFKLFNEQNGGPNCNRCGRPTTLATVLPRFGDSPAYNIFQCNVLQCRPMGSRPPARLVFAIDICQRLAPAVSAAPNCHSVR